MQELVAQARTALSRAALDAQEPAIDRWHDEPAGTVTPGCDAEVSAGR